VVTKNAQFNEKYMWQRGITLRW